MKSLCYGKVGEETDTNFNDFSTWKIITNYSWMLITVPNYELASVLFGNRRRNVVTIRTCTSSLLGPLSFHGI